MLHSHLHPQWPSPKGVAAISTTRLGGFGDGPFESLNLGLNCGDDDQVVARNRALLTERLGLPRQPAWLNQVHGSEVVDLAHYRPGVKADAATSRLPGQVCAVLTADCLPVLLCDREGSSVAAAHGGWRGLAAGVLAATVNAMGADPGQLMAWLGPAIGPAAFEVGPEVMEAFVKNDPTMVSAFQPGRGDRLQADLFAIARHQLRALGLTEIHGGGQCTHSDEKHFFSYRRDGRCGRMMSAIWLESRA